MTYRDIAKDTIKAYAKYVVDSGYEMKDYDTYRDTFYSVLAYILKIQYCSVDVGIVKEISKGYRIVLKEQDLLRQLKRNKEISFNIVKALFDIVIRDLKESEEVQ